MGRTTVAKIERDFKKRIASIDVRSEVLSKATALGRARFLSGGNATPAHDPAVTEMISEVSGTPDSGGVTIRILENWSRGWTEENLKSI